MSIEFKFIRWKNFLSTGNVFSELDLSKAGTTLIVGENGSGKSTMLDALTFGLFGKPFRNINKGQLVNSITRKDALVEIEFWSSSNMYRIVRGIKPNLFEVYCNEKLINQDAEMKDYQAILEKQILKINFKSFCQVVVLGSASFVPFMQLTGPNRRAIIEDLLDLEIFTKMNVLLKEQIQQNEKDVQETENNKKIVKTKIEIVHQHLKELRSKNEEFIKQKETTIAEHVLNIKESMEEVKILQVKISELEAIKEDRTHVYNDLNKLRDYRTKSLNNKDIFKKEISFFKKHENCPTCSQGIEPSFAADIVKDREAKVAKIDNTMIKWEEANKKANDRMVNITKIESDISEVSSLLMQFQQSIKHNKSICITIQNEIDNAKKSVKQTTETKIADLEKDLTQIQEKFNSFQEDRQVLAAAALMLKDGGIKTKIINQYIPVINKLVNKYLAMMDFFVSFEMNSEFQESIKSRYRDDFSYASFSEGEKQKIDLSLLFTWRAIAKLRNSISTNLLILDEVFDSSLDSSGTDQLMAIIQSLASDNSMFVISHKEQMNDKFNNIIRFTKHKNFSKMESAA